MLRCGGYLDGIVAGKFARPSKPPTLTCPLDWNPKVCDPSGYIPVSLPVSDEGPPQLHAVQAAQPPEAEDMQEAPPQAGKKKQIHHKYLDNVVDFYFNFEKLHGLSRNATVKLVKKLYPKMFPESFRENQVRL